MRNPFAAQRRQMSDYDEALRLLWSDDMTAVDEITGDPLIDDDTVEWVGEVLGLNTTTPKPRSDATPQHRYAVIT